MFWPYNRTMAMGTRKMRERQEELWYGGELPTAPGHPFYKRLNDVLDKAKFDIAARLGIRPGTVKIHLKHIFEKTGIRGRYGLALSGLREKGLLSMPAA